jgi:hypothetical protein
MPLTRQFTKIPALRPALELLVALQVDGHLDGFETPSWATGTSVEELLDALRSLEDGEWLAGVYPGHGLFESADRWIGDFMDGNEVPTKADVVDASNQDEDDDDEGRALGGLMEYLKHAPAELRARFEQRLEDPRFRDLALRSFNSLGLAVASMVGASDEELEAMDGEFIFLQQASAQDKDLAAMSLSFMKDNFDAILASLDLEEVTAKRAKKIAKTMVARIEKSAKATS